MIRGIAGPVVANINHDSGSRNAWYFADLSAATSNESRRRSWQKPASAFEISEGEKLERQMASEIQAKNWKAVEATIADGFQPVHPDGIRDRAGEIAVLKDEFRGVHIKRFQIDDYW